MHVHILNGQLEILLAWYCLVVLLELQVCKDDYDCFLSFVQYHSPVLYL